MYVISQFVNDLLFCLSLSICLNVNRGGGEYSCSAVSVAARCCRLLSGFADFLNILEELVRHKITNFRTYSNNLLEALDQFFYFASINLTTILTTFLKRNCQPPICIYDQFLTNWKKSLNQEVFLLETCWKTLSLLKLCWLTNLSLHFYTLLVNKWVGLDGVNYSTNWMWANCTGRLTNYR